MSTDPKSLEQILAELAAPLNPDYIKDLKGIKYIDARYVIYRFNAVCPANWSWEFKIVHNPTTDGKVYVDGTLSITVDGVTVSRSGAGEAKGQKPNPNFNPDMPENAFHDNNPKINKENKRFTAGAFGGGFKAAESDALKRAASKYGFAIELYPGDNPEETQEALNNHPDKQWGEPTPPPPNSNSKKSIVKTDAGEAFDLRLFWAKVKSLGYTQESAYVVLGIESLKADYPHSQDTALKALEEAATEQVPLFPDTKPADTTYQE